ncbi:hypothetical protein EPO05_04055 [Patescibacteria group bacterium]|nr:MAG: hypothetical protein EPO05_04055 [Patescibacteria group bacterium]
MKNSQHVGVYLFVAVFLAAFFVTMPVAAELTQNGTQVPINYAIEPLNVGAAPGAIGQNPPTVLGGNPTVPSTGQDLSQRDNIVATTSVYDCKVVSQEGNRLKISFGMANGVGAQPQIHYSIQLTKMDKDGHRFVIDEQVSDEIFDIGPGEEVKREAVYSAPDFLTGKYQIWIAAKNNNNLNLGFSTAGDITLSGSGKYLEVVPETCFLTVGGDAGQKYSLVYGVDVEKTEQLFLNCLVRSHLDQEISATPSFNNFWRNSAGKKVGSQKLDPVTFRPDVDTEIKLLIPKADRPQAYDAVLSLLNEKQLPISNGVTMHYVLRGASATIQNILFDKDYYAEGDTARISFFWTPAASAFQGSRKNNAADQVEAQLSIVVLSNGQKCGEIDTKSITKNEQNLKIDIPIVQDCLNPEARVSIKDQRGETLDEGVFSVTSKNLSKGSVLKTGSSEGQEKKVPVHVIALIIAGIVAIFGIASAYVARKRSGKIIPVLWLVALSMLLAGGEVRATALSWNLPAIDENGVSTTAYYTVNFRNNPWNIYSPGGLVTIDATGSGGACSNGWGAHGLITQNYLGTQTQVFYSDFAPGETVTSSSGVHQFSAPNSPGVYPQYFIGLAYFGPNDNIALRWQYYNWQTMYYYVVAPAPIATPTCSGSNSTATVTGSAFAGASNYQIRLDTDTSLKNGFWYKNISSLSDATVPEGFSGWNGFSSFSGYLNPGTTYYTNIAYFNASWGYLGYESPWKSFVASSCTLAAPTLVSSCSSGTPTINASWPAGGQSGSSGYWVDVDNDNNWNNGYIAAYQIPAGTTSKVINTGLTSGMTYYVRVYYIQAGTHGNTSSIMPVCPGSSLSVNSSNLCIPEGEKATLTYGSSGSASCTGRSVPNDPNWNFAWSSAYLSGTKQVQPSQSTTYYFKCRDAALQETPESSVVVDINTMAAGCLWSGCQTESPGCGNGTDTATCWGNCGKPYAGTTPSPKTCSLGACEGDKWRETGN